MQAWLLIGVPALVLAAALFYGRSPLRAGLGYLVVLGGFAGMTVYHRVSGVLFGGLVALYAAAGRGSASEQVDTGASQLGVPDEALHPLRRGLRP